MTLFRANYTNNRKMLGVFRVLFFVNVDQGCRAYKNGF